MLRNISEILNFEEFCTLDLYFDDVLSVCVSVVKENYVLTHAINEFKQISFNLY